MRTAEQIKVINVALFRILHLVKQTTDDSNPQIFEKIDVAMTIAKTKLKGISYEPAIIDESVFSHDGM